MLNYIHNPGGTVITMELTSQYHNKYLFSWLWNPMNSYNPEVLMLEFNIYEMASKLRSLLALDPSYMNLKVLLLNE